MGKQHASIALARAAFGNSLMMRVGKANGLKVAQVRALLGVSGLRSLGVFVSAGLVERRCSFPMRTGRAAVYSVIKSGHLVRASVGKGRKARLTLELTATGMGVVLEYERVERKAIETFLGKV